MHTISAVQSCIATVKQERHAVAEKPRDAAVIMDRYKVMCRPLFVSFDTFTRQCPLPSVIDAQWVGRSRNCGRIFAVCGPKFTKLNKNMRGSDHRFQFTDILLRSEIFSRKAV